MPFDLKTYARVGAQARLAELQHEMDAIFRAFPDLRVVGRGRRGKAAASAASDDGAGVARGRRRRKPMTAAQRKAVGLRMKKYWAARRKREAKE